MEIRALRPDDDRSGFQAGDETLDRFFHRYAGQNQFRHYLGATYVAVDGGRLLGFATVTPRQLEIESLPERARRKLPRYPLPVLGLARMAVDASAQGRGLGAQLLRSVLALAVKMSEELGCTGVVVEARPDAIGFYAKYGFERFEALEGQSDARPRPIAMWLSIREIAAAIGRSR